ncbi:sialate O-acetylesterase [Actomonas aquatica]|uniref:Sialate O-acetylesterase n=1 Tax=Actomonas aquatica TaxID=2866162 RepID=A0ABZ1C2D2_9BACT|nr:sialate O-acetylesterase [Opitutus sp. WL0086]WRQ85576.1 sialate O-acetylesterase [Opitutus sp. WL0086]
MKIPSAILVALSLTAVASADVVLAPLFTDHGVLQRDQAVPVWGTADAGEAVTVSFAGQSVSTTADEAGKWRVDLAAMPVNATGQTLTVNGHNTLTLTDILVGDVWLCGGQSNMEWPLRNTTDADTAIPSANFPLIRHIKIERRIARDPLTTATGSWTVCSPETVPHFTAVGYYFARQLHAELGVPIGLVNSNWGGTPAEAWLPPAALEDLDILLAATSHQAYSYTGIHANLVNYQEKLAAWEADPENVEKPSMPWRPGAENHSLVLNNGMIAPLAPYGLKGVIWYQGEANADQPETYRTLFGAVIESWRDQFEQPELPFYWVQLANWQPGGIGWAFLREAQTQTLELPHTGQVVINDVGDPDDIHPRNKTAVGDRLARVALRRLHGFDIEDTGPTFASAILRDATIELSFTHAAGLHTTDGAAPKGFQVAGADGVFHPATAALTPNGTIKVTSDAVSIAHFVRYAWDGHLEVNLVNGDDLPAAPFRTDRL